METEKGKRGLFFIFRVTPASCEQKSRYALAIRANSREETMDNNKIDQHSDEIEVESEEKERGKKIEIDEDRLPSRAMAIHEHIRQDGEKELERDAMALLWSAIAAGLSMGASLLAKGIFQVELEGVPGSFLLENLGYTFGLLSSLWPASNYLPKTP